MLSPLLQGLDPGKCISCNATAVRQKRCCIEKNRKQKSCFNFYIFILIQLAFAGHFYHHKQVFQLELLGVTYTCSKIGY